MTAGVKYRYLSYTLVIYWCISLLCASAVHLSSNSVGTLSKYIQSIIWIKKKIQVIVLSH